MMTPQRHVEFVLIIFNYTVKQVFGFNDYDLRIMKRKMPVNSKKMILGYINFQKKIICLDVFTPKKRQPKSINSLLRTIAHEIAHIQKPPFRQRYKGRYIVRQHYPAFYKQVTKNVEKIKKDSNLSRYFVKGDFSCSSLSE